MLKFETNINDNFLSLNFIDSLAFTKLYLRILNKQYSLSNFHANTAVSALAKPKGGWGIQANLIHSFKCFTIVRHNFVTFDLFHFKTQFTLLDHLKPEALSVALLVMG